MQDRRRWKELIAKLPVTSVINLRNVYVSVSMRDSDRSIRCLPKPAHHPFVSSDTEKVELKSSFVALNNS